MQAIGIAVIILGIAIMLAGSVMIFLAACRQSGLWGLAYFFIPFAALVFWIKHWDESKNGFKFKGVGLAVLFLGAIFASIGADGKPKEAVPVAKAPTAASVATTRSYSLEEERARLNLPAYEATRKDRRDAPRPPAPQPKQFEQVWADTATKSYYADGCKKLPPNAYRVAKSAVKAQGFTEGSCR